MIILKWLYYKIFSSSHQKSLTLSIRMNVTLYKVSSDLVIFNLLWLIIAHIKNFIYSSLLLCNYYIIYKSEILFSEYSKQNSIINLYCFLTIILHICIYILPNLRWEYLKLNYKSSILDKIQNYLTHFYFE